MATHVLGVLFGIVIIALVIIVPIVLIAVPIALTVFLIRRSRH